MSLFGFFCGRTEFAAAGKDAAKIFNLCMAESIHYVGAAWDGEHFLLRVEGRAVKRFAELCERERIEIEVRRERGLPALLARYRSRPGIWLGLLSVLLLLAMARSVIWNIEIDGNDRLSRAHILSLLAENGVEVGSPLRALQIDRVEGNLLLAEKDISWVALYAVGTTLHVQVRETERGAPPEQGAANLVAARDGVIERIEVYDGNLAVKVGDVVRQGELLVSGVYDAAAGGAIRTTFAEGEVFARTAREYTSEIPLLYEQKVYTGREWSEKRIKFFAKSIKVFANSGNAPTTCDIIYYNYSLNFFGGDPLPLGVSTAVYREYTTETVELSPQSAAAQAFSEIEGELAKLSEGIELLEKRYSFELTDTAYVLTCRITCVENIAVTQPIKLGA